jgi:hypothetical protein
MMDDLTYSSSINTFRAQTSPSEMDNSYTHDHVWQALDYYGMGTEIPPDFIQVIQFEICLRGSCP